MKACIAITFALCTLVVDGVGHTEQSEPVAPSRIEADANALSRARRHFEDALHLVQTERWEEALRGFQASLAAHETSVAHFNMCLCLRRLERDVQAGPCYLRYLRLHADGGSSEERAEVRNELEQLRGVLGSIEIDAGPPEPTHVFLDGEEVGATPLEDAIFVTPGRHTIELRADGFVPARRELAVAAGSQMTLLISLERIDRGVGTLLITSPLPGVAVFLDGERIGTTPLLEEALAVAAGSHRVEASRQGYETQEVELSLTPGESRRVELELGRTADSLPEHSGNLILQVSEEGAEALLDGAPFSPGPVPAGPHRIEVRREGFQTWTRDLEISAGRSTTIEVELHPTPTYLEEYRQRAGRIRGAGWATGAIGVALLGTAVGLLVWNDGRHDDWETENAALRDTTAPDRDRRLAENGDLLDSVEAFDVVNWVLFGLGASSLGVGLGLIFGGPGPDRYERLGLTIRPGGMVLSGCW